MNGNWFPWAPSCSWSCEQTGQQILQSAQSYVNMWRHVVFTFDSLGMRNTTRLNFIWGVNNVDFQGNDISQFYPGDEYVDWVAIDGFNFGDRVPSHSWESANNVFPDSLFASVASVAPSKPIAVTEFGSVTSPKGVTEKNKWIQDAFTIFRGQDVRMINSYNIFGDTDFGVFAGPNGNEKFSKWNGFSAYREALSEYWIFGSDLDNPRLISDSLFQQGI